MWSALRLTAIRVRFRAVQACELPPYAGSTLRGTLGHGLRGIGCLEWPRTCAECRRPGACAYGALFEPTGDSSRRLPPYVLSLPRVRRQYEPGDFLDMGLMLVGSSRRWLPWVVFALEQMGARGLGADRAPWVLDAVAVAGPGGITVPIVRSGQGLRAGQRCPELDGASLVAARPFRPRVTVRFLTPTHLKDEGRSVGMISGDVLARRIVRRLSELLKQYCGWDASGFDFPALVAAGHRIACTDQRLRPANWERRSTRQRGLHPMVGFVGEVTLNEIPQDLWPYLVIGEAIHVGKSASFGMGQYVLLAPGDDDPDPRA